MNGPEHYREAEVWLQRAKEIEATPRCHMAKSYAAIALGHAVLAQTAATANVERSDAGSLAERPSAWDGGKPGAGLTWPEVLR